MRQPTTIEELRRQVRASLRNMDATPAAPLPTETEIDRQLTQFWGEIDKNTTNRRFIEGISDPYGHGVDEDEDDNPTPRKNRSKAVADDLRSMATFARKHTAIIVTYHDGSQESLFDAAPYFADLLGVERQLIFRAVKTHIVP